MGCVAHVILAPFDVDAITIYKFIREARKICIELYVAFLYNERKMMVYYNKLRKHRLHFGIIGRH